MPSSLTREQALDHFLGFPHQQAIVIQLPGRVPWHVPPTVDPRQLTFDGVEGETLVDVELHGGVRRKRGATGHDLRDFEVWWPPIPVPAGFALRDGALGWQALRDLRQFLREAFPPGSGVVGAPSVARVLIEERNALVERIRSFFGDQPDSFRALRGAARSFLDDKLDEPASLYGTLRALRTQMRRELPEEDEIRREMLADEDADRTKVVLPEPLRALVATARAERRVGRPPTTSLVVTAGHEYRLKPRQVAMLVALERDETAQWEEHYASYFDPKGAAAASSAWRKIYHRAR